MAIKPINIPIATTNKVMSRNLVKQMASDGFLPVIALEAFVEAGRTYQAYKRGGFDEARERITEEFSGAVFWLGGVTALNWVFEKIGQAILKLPNINVSIASDGVRNPLLNYLANERTKDGAKILEKTMAKFKFIKVISSVLIANALIGLVLPKVNQAITRSYHKNDKNNPVMPEEQTPVANNVVLADSKVNPFVARPTFNNFAQTNDEKENKKDISFGLNLLTLANKFESDRNWKLLSVDVGTSTGRAYSARNNDERVEILFRDIASIYFYMFNMSNMNTWLNKIEQRNEKSNMLKYGTRLDPVSAEFATKYMEGYVNSMEGKKVDIETFRRDMFGQKVEIPEALKAKFTGDDIKTISLENFKEALKSIVSPSELKEFEQTAELMSKLQPQLDGVSRLTLEQVEDILAGGHINNPEFLREFFKNRFGNNFLKPYKFISQSEITAHKHELIDYVNAVIESAKKTNAGEITEKLLHKVSNNNLKLNAINWGSGFIVSALFLSTIIPKVQYLITKWRTGSDQFPGTKEFREEEQSKQVA